MGTESCWELSYYFFDWRISKENLQTRDFRTSYPATILKTQVGEGMKWCDRLCRAQFGIAISLLLWHLRFRNHGLFTFIRFILELKPRNTDKLGILNSIIARTREVRAHWTADRTTYSESVGVWRGPTATFRSRYPSLATHGIQIKTSPQDQIP